VLVNSYHEMFDAQVLAAAKAHLDAAGQVAAGDPDLQSRIAFIRHGYDYTALMVELLDLYEKAGAQRFPAGEL
jgi:hypothetical protein